MFKRVMNEIARRIGDTWMKYTDPSAYAVSTLRRYHRATATLFTPSK